MVRTHVQLTPSQATAVRRMAAQRHVSVSEIVRQSLDAFVGNGELPAPERGRHRALEIIGAIKGGPRDISARHDDYAVEAYEA